MEWDDLPDSFTLEWYEDAYDEDLDGWGQKDNERLQSFLDKYERLVEATQNGEEWMTESEFDELYPLEKYLPEGEYPGYLEGYRG